MALAWVGYLFLSIGTPNLAFCGYHVGGYMVFSMYQVTHISYVNIVIFSFIFTDRSLKLIMGVHSVPA